MFHVVFLMFCVTIVLCRWFGLKPKLSKPICLIISNHHTFIMTSSAASNSPSSSSSNDAVKVMHFIRQHPAQQVSVTKSWALGATKFPARPASFGRRPAKPLVDILDDVLDLLDDESCSSESSSCEPTRSQASHSHTWDSNQTLSDDSDNHSSMKDLWEVYDAIAMEES
jgi:hypothetical protein